MSSMPIYALMVVAALMSTSAIAAEAWIQTPRVENRQTHLTPTSWGVVSRYTGGLYMDANGIVRTAEATIANSAVFRTSGGSGPALWDIAWSITNEGTGDFTRFIAMAGAPPHFVRDGLTPGETEFENATVSGPVTVAQWNGQWGNTLTASGGAVYFFAAATIPEPGTMTLFGLALLILSSGVHRRRSGAGGSYPCAFASVTQS